MNKNNIAKIELDDQVWEEFLAFVDMFDELCGNATLKTKSSEGVE